MYFFDQGGGVVGLLDEAGQLFAVEALRRFGLVGPKSEYGRKCATLSTFLIDFNRALCSSLAFELSQTGN
ncbi:MAG: hypothetical protein IPM39_12290 [Chloroflexi bacterium]|nr:hypothetical protein [Chloroflexota bacterium]